MGPRITPPAADTSAGRRVYLNLSAGARRGHTEPRLGAPQACLRIHSHLGIKLLTLMLLVMFGPAPTHLNLQRPTGRLGNRSEAGEEGESAVKD